jgi:hypothetical protein
MLREVDFEDHQEKLRELQRDYVKLAATDPDAADRLKETRLAMVILNYPKTSVRLAEADFYGRYLEKRLPADLRPATAREASVDIPGLPGVSVSGASAEAETSRALTDSLLRASAAARAGAKLDLASVTKADGFIREARKTFDVAVKMAGQNAQLQKRQVAVTERISDAADYVNQCAAEFAEARAKRALDEDAFDDALLTLKESLTRLAKQAQRAFEAPNDGVAWLLDSTRDR